MAKVKKATESLADITTEWSVINDTTSFVSRYAPAIHGYLQALLPASADVEEILQDFLVSVVEGGFKPANVRGGRFRDYLIAAVRYRAWRWLRRKRLQPLTPEFADGLMAAEQVESGQAEWLAGWRQCLLDRAWRKLEFKQQHTRGNWHFAVLKLKADHPQATSEDLAAKVGAKPPLSAPAFRKQLSRARAAFGLALIVEVERTLDNPMPEAVLEELAELGLLVYVRPYFDGKCPPGPGP
jgi:hypothetical protein